MLKRLQANPVKKTILVIVLPCVAGAVNGSGLLEVGAFTSHMTGNSSRLGQELAQAHWSLALRMASMIGSFLFGAMVGAAVVDYSKQRSRARYAIGLLLEAFALSVVTAATVHGGERSLPSTELVALLCFAMGLQNAMITRLSGAVVRTTHVTGIVTDIGIELVHLYEWLRRRTQARHPLLHWATLRQLREDPELAQLRVHSTILLSFITGSTLGAFLYLRIGFLALLAPVLAVLALSVFDLRAGLDPPPRTELGPVDSGAHTLIPEHEREPR